MFILVTWLTSVTRPAVTYLWYSLAGVYRSLSVTGRIAVAPEVCPGTFSAGPVIASVSSIRQRNAYDPEPTSSRIGSVVPAPSASTVS